MEPGTSLLMALPSIFVIIIPRIKIQRILNAKKILKKKIHINYYYIKNNEFDYIIIFFLKRILYNISYAFFFFFFFFFF